MADVQLSDLSAALKGEGVEFDEAQLTRAFRKLTNPSGCENCGMHVKVGHVKHGDEGYGVYTACCNHFEAPADEPVEVPTRRSRKRTNG